MITKFHRTDLVIWSHFRRPKTLSYSWINTVRKSVFVLESNLINDLYLQTKRED